MNAIFSRAQFAKNVALALSISAVVSVFAVCNANASPRHHKHHHVTETLSAAHGDPKPAAWCAWWLRRYLGIHKTEFPPYQYNMARAFAKIGQPANKGCVGCVAVFSRGRGGHVGIVKSWDTHGNPILLSGNVNGRVAVAVHQANRMIALRWVDGTSNHASAGKTEAGMP